MLNRGSEWRRWEPHIHGPGTILNNQFGGPTSWEEYLKALEQAVPAISAIAVTDYYVTETYERVIIEKRNGRLAGIELIFPNIELRLDVATSKGGFVNMHLFVSPEDPEHLIQLKRLLARLSFKAFGDRFDCTREELIRLGKAADPTISDEGAALTHGAGQFKVNFSELRDVFQQSEWAKKNILVAVAGGATDGTAGVREAADKTMREEIEKFAHIIFASSTAQREFWLGERAVSVEQLHQRYGGPKPCLHGSDAHKLADVGLPFGNRFSWIKGGLEFDALRQACIDPGGRAYVGSEPPQRAAPSQVIESVRIANAAWAKTPDIPMNPGLVAIIGARGSGKTALADLIAAGCDSIPDEAWQQNPQSSPSFLARARPLIDAETVSVKWASGNITTRHLDGSDANEPSSYPRVRYLSQQFVEDLCSSGGLSDGLMREIERVLFEAHSEEQRDSAVDFADLLEQRATRFRQARSREAEAVLQISDSVSAELEKERLVPHYEGLVAQKRKQISDYTADRSKLVTKGSEENVARHGQLAAAADKIRRKIRAHTAQRQTFIALQDEVGDMRRNQAPEELRQTKSRHPSSGMNDGQWDEFLLDYKGKVDTKLDSYLRAVDAKLAALKGTAPVAKENEPYIALDADLETIPLAVLEAEIARLEKLVSAEQAVQKKYRALSAKITSESTAFQALSDKLEDAKGAKERARKLTKDREEAYKRVFEAIVAEQRILEELYAPLMDRMRQATGSLKKLSFFVQRTADVESWATYAEEDLIDLRKQGPFRGKGTLAERANETLKAAWQAGSPAEVSAAMTEFRAKYQADLLAHSPVAQTDRTEFRAWSKRFGQWLLGTDHIEIKYGIEYDGVEIQKLSPGTRGIVLLLLYLALDDADDRPLVIDQPEENLDPKSVFEELVKLFVDAKRKRQVIIVTHNANLVVNTDADQIIIAECGPSPARALPPIFYKSGGLENAEIRKAVCDILEGGEAAFQERARRLRVKIQR